MSAYEIVLLVLHVVGAIIAFGPTFTFAILGPLAGKHQGPGGVALMEGMIAIERRLIQPFAALQPVTGALLIFARGWNEGFFDHTWLWLGIALYSLDTVLVLTLASPALHRLHDLAKAGPPSPETVAQMQALASRTRRVGAYVGLSTLVIATLMVWKPGG